MPENNKMKQEKVNDSRFLIAKIVLPISIGGVLAMAFIMFIVSDDDNTAQYVFGAILPLLGTWVGTILAYYFSSENFESANINVRKMADRLTPMERLISIPIRAKMRPRKKMEVVTIEKAKPLEKVKIQVDILNQFIDKDRNRLPVLDENDYPRYIIHRSMIDKYLTHKIVTDKLAIDKLRNLSLKNLFDDDPETKLMFENSFATVPIDANLADAKNEMEKIPNCLDVFITQNGTKNEPVMGWLTNNAIVASAQV